MDSASRRGRRPVPSPVLLCAGLWQLVGCNDRERPAYAEDPAMEPPDGTGGTVFDIGDSEPSPPESPCGTTVQRLELERPNLYFAIDASGSMSEPIAGPVAQDRYSAVVNALELVLRQIGHRVNFGGTVFPGNGQSGCDPGRELTPFGPGDAVSYVLSGEAGPALSRFTFALRQVTRTGGTPIASTLEALEPGLNALAEDTYLFLLTDGAPNCNLAASCPQNTCVANIEGWQLTPDVVCDETINCCEFFLGACLDQEATREVVERLGAAGVRTFVIGVPGSALYAELLDELAVLGNTARGGSPRYYEVGDSEELSETLFLLGEEVSLSCAVELESVPPDPTLVNVYLDTELIPFGNLDGWQWTGERSLEVTGTPCELLLAGQVLELRAVAGCPVIVR